VARVARFTVQAAADRAAEGRLTFHDLLVHARRLLRHDAAARTALRRRYRYLLVDEFQDTDPLQVELAAWLASAVEGGGAIDGGLGTVLGGARPGALFVVGDPKQSIYRFRRADIALFERVCADIGDEAVLSANFRSVPGIVELVNTVFPALFEAGDGQPAYRPLDAQRRRLPSTLPAGTVQLTLAGIDPEEPEPPWLALPPVVVLGGAIDGSLGEVRRSAARDTAAAIHRVMAERWPVSDPSDPEAPPRPPRWRDRRRSRTARRPARARREQDDRVAELIIRRRPRRPTLPARRSPPPRAACDGAWTPRRAARPAPPAPSASPPSRRAECAAARAR